MKVVALDPGGTTGICVLDTESYEIRLGELGPDVHHKELWDLLGRYRWQAEDDGEEMLIVCESFEYRIVKSKGTKMPGVNLISRNYIGVVELFDQCFEVGLVMQTPAQGGGGHNHSGFWKNDKLKKLGLYKAPEGRQHMADALRHALYWLSFTKKDDHFIRLLKQAKPPL